MTDHIHTDACVVYSGAICGGGTYAVRVQPAPRRRWQTLGKPARSYRAALRRVADAIASHNYRRGQVWLIAEYYDPVMICETEAQ